MTCQTHAPARSGAVLEASGQHTKALHAYGEVLCRRPSDAKALADYKRALLCMDDAWDGLNDLAIALAQWGQVPQAMECLEEAMGLSPGHAETYNNLGLMLKGQGHVYEAIPWYRRAVEIRPDYANAQWNLGLALLLIGQYGQGWEGFAWRRKANLEAFSPWQKGHQPTWAGQDLEGKTLLVRYEQGMGDCIQMVRYARLLKHRGATVVLEAHSGLADLLACVHGVDQVVAPDPNGLSRTPHDLDVFIMDLPRLLGTTANSIPATVPYIHPDPAKTALWARRLAGPGLKVGLVWAGSPKHTNDASRSCPLHLFRTALEVPGIQFYGCQLGPARSQLADLGDLTPRLTDLAGDLKDFSDTACALANLDLLISVDTAALHLAGAMGRPAWALLPFVPDWRWLLDRQDSPWYPSVRLFRQERPGHWAGVMETVARELRVLDADR